VPRAVHVISERLPTFVTDAEKPEGASVVPVIYPAIPSTVKKSPATVFSPLNRNACMVHVKSEPEPVTTGLPGARLARAGLPTAPTITSAAKVRIIVSRVRILMFYHLLPLS
jgi:hypothetical protein